MNEQVKELVEKLTEKSRRGGVIWKKDAGEFGVHLPAGAVFIDEDEYGYLDTTYNIYINNDKDECIYRNVVNERADKGCFDLLRKLYCSARASYYGAGRIYEEMLKGIESADIIGRETN